MIYGSDSGELTSSLPLRCVQCGKDFAARSYLERHLDVHNADKVHRCPICPKRFQSQPSLSQHKATHGQLQLQGRFNI